MKQKNFWKNMLIGFLGGMISGFFSSGGGLILVPYLTAVLKIDEVKARATTIFCIFFMVFTSGLFYFNQNYIDWQIAIKCALRWNCWWVYWVQGFVECWKKIFRNFIHCVFGVCWNKNDNGVKINERNCFWYCVWNDCCNAAWVVEQF